MSNERLIIEIRARRPGLVRRADKGSALAAARLFCLECVGHSALEVKQCDDTLCPLHPFRFGKRPKREASPNEQEAPQQEAQLAEVVQVAAPEEPKAKKRKKKKKKKKKRKPEVARSDDADIPV